MFRLGRLIRAIILMLTLAAVAKELNKPEAERTWHGRIAGVPYDFRWPTLKRFKQAYWNPADDRIFTDRVIGVGWAINLAQVLPRARNAYLRLSER
jgi:hypothetical protein